MVRVRVRNYNESSDLGLLLLLDKPKKEKDDWDNYAWPFVEKGQGPDIKEIVCDQTHTKDTWLNGGPIPCSFLMWRKTRIFLYESSLKSRYVLSPFDIRQPLVRCFSPDTNKKFSGQQ